MKKFPVISENGNEYMVKIRKTIAAYHYDVFIYRKRKVFGIPYFRQLNGGFLDSNIYSAIEYNFDFVEIAKSEISRLERKWETRKEREIEYLEGVMTFEEWDGDMRNE